MKTITKLTYKQRQEIHRAWFSRRAKVLSVQDLARQYGVNTPTIRNILAGRVKLSKSSRRDKGLKKGAPRDLSGVDPAESLDAGWDMRQHLEYQSTKLLEDLVVKRINIIDKSKILDIIARIQKQLKAQEIEAHIKRTDAQVIARIIRRYVPDATDTDVIKIFREELDRWQVEN